MRLDKEQHLITFVSAKNSDLSQHIQLFFIVLKALLYIRMQVFYSQQHKIAFIMTLKIIK